jgi:hypothetical protein
VSDFLRVIMGVYSVWTGWDPGMGSVIVIERRKCFDVLYFRYFFSPTLLLSRFFASPKSMAITNELFFFSCTC